MRQKLDAHGWILIAKCYEAMNNFQQVLSIFDEAEQYCKVFKLAWEKPSEEIVEALQAFLARIRHDPPQIESSDEGDSYDYIDVTVDLPPESSPIHPPLRNDSHVINHVAELLSDMAIQESQHAKLCEDQREKENLGSVTVLTPIKVGRCEGTK